MLIRNTHSKTEVVTRDDKRFIVGYAAVFYRDDDEKTEYRLWKDLVERVSPKAFDRALKEKDDVRALLNHDPNILLSRVGNGLKLSTDEKGLRYEFPVDEEDPDHKRVVAKLIRGDMSGSSFGFFRQKSTFIETEDDKPDVLELNQVELVDVSPATFPAYEATEVGLRSDIKQSIESLRNEYLNWKQSKVDEMQKYRMQLLRAEAGI